MDIKTEILNDLMKLPEVILQAGTDLYRKKKLNDEYTLAQKKITFFVNAEVANEKDENGKAKYSNADKREIECESRLARNSEWVAYDVNKETLKKEIDDLNLKMEFFNNKLKSARAVARIIGVD